MNKSYEIEEIILKINYNKNQQSRIQYLQKLKDLDLFNSTHVNFLEDLAISENNLVIRKIALEILINKFYNKSNLLIEWILQFSESSKIVAKVSRLLFKKDKDHLKKQIIRFFESNLKEETNLSLTRYNKELLKLFKDKPCNSFPIDKLLNIYLNYNFILNLEKCYRFSKNVNSMSLTYRLKEGVIFELRIWGLNLQKVSDIDGIELLEFLRVLDLSGNNLKEIDGLKSLRSLEILKFGDLNYETGNQIFEIRGLSNLNNLRILNLSNNYIKEINGLDNLETLERLYLVNNSIKELGGLKKLRNLIYLNLERNFISKIQGLDKLSSLKILVLGKNSISIVDNISNLPNLKELRIYDNPISEFKPPKLESELEVKLYSSEIKQMKWLDSIKGIQIKSAETMKPTEYESRYLQ